MLPKAHIRQKEVLIINIKENGAPLRSIPPLKNKSSHGKRYLACKASIRRYFKTHPWAKTYSGIKSRCNNPKQPNYSFYGAAGIRCLISMVEVKALWLRDMASAMVRPSIDRVDPNGHYTFENCRFIEFTENLKRPKRLKIAVA